MKNILILLCVFVFISCGDDDSSGGNADNYDRSEMLINWSDNIIIPAYTDFQLKLTNLKNATETFTNDLSQENLITLRNEYLTANKTWQYVMMFSSLGKADELDVNNWVNRYPTDVTLIESNIADNNTNFILPSTNTQQGFPALDYMLYGIANTDVGILSKYSDSNYKSYLNALVTRLIDLNDTVLDDWNNGYKDIFVQSSGNTAASSVNIMVNDYIYYYEKFFRTYKLGGPLGAFSGLVRPQDVESYYGKHSKELCLSALDAIEDFYNGKSYKGNSESASLKTYLEYLDAKKDGETLVPLMLAQLENVREKVNLLESDFSLQIQNDESSAMNTYYAMQRMIVFLKIDMLSAFNIGTDYVDNDGD